MSDNDALKAVLEEEWEVMLADSGTMNNEELRARGMHVARLVKGIEIVIPGPFGVSDRKTHRARARVIVAGKAALAMLDDLIYMTHQIEPRLMHFEECLTPELREDMDYLHKWQEKARALLDGLRDGDA